MGPSAIPWAKRRATPSAVIINGYFDLTGSIAIGGEVTSTKYPSPPPRFAFSRIPLNHRVLFVPRLTVKVNRCTVIDNTPVNRPTPGPLGVKPDIEGVRGEVAPAGAVAR